MSKQSSARTKAWSLEARYLDTAFPADGVGGRLAVAVQDPSDFLLTGLVTDPDIPNDASTTASVTVGGASFVSTINTPGDQDWIRVQLQAGITYEIGLFSSTNGASGVPLFDPLVELYNADGLFEGMDDSSGPSSPNGTDDALLTFTPDASGVYYINARAWDTRDPAGLSEDDPNPLTTTGDYVGDYETFVRVRAEDTDGPYYPIDYETADDPSTERDEIGLPTLDSSPLHAIDWDGRLVNKMHQAVRNPDGEEGPRPTGNPFEATSNEFGITGKNVITVYFAKAGEVYIDEDPTTPGTTDSMVSKGFEPWEMAAYQSAFEAYSNVADIVYVVVDDAYDPLTRETTADFTFILYEGTTGTSVDGVAGTPSLLGRMSPPDEDNEGHSEFNANDKRWTEEGLAPGGFSFTTLIHEMGHGHGLAHPHDTGGGSSILRGVEAEGVAFDYTNGDFDLNQSVFTMMSYEDGWQKSPYGQAATTDPFGWLGGLSAFDIAAIQDKYGVNEDAATGNDVYALKDVNAAGTFYSCIWDAGGTDVISYDGDRDAVIDLRPASLKYEEGGGGWMSYAWGIFGGYTIANAVTIENATSGSGDDTLTGNAVANRLDSGAGNDVLDGGGGADTMIGGMGADTYHVDSRSDVIVETHSGGTDTVISTISLALAANLENLTYKGTSAASLTGNEIGNKIDASSATAAVNANGGAGNDVMLGGAAGDTLLGADGNDSLNGGAGDDILQGRLGNDVLSGGAGNDRFYGGAGANTMIGGGGTDLFIFLDDALDAATDVVRQFSSKEGDRIHLGNIDANSALAGNQAFTFIGSGAFTGAAGQMRLFVDGSGNQVAAGDVDGDKVADLMIQFQNPVLPITAADFVF